MLYLVRHGETAANVDGLLLGRADPPLTDLGARQAARLATVLPRPDRHLDAARAVAAPLAAARLRVTVDARGEQSGDKMREAQLQQIPYMLVLGDREAAEGTVSVRSRRGGALGARPVEAFLDDARREIQQKGR